MARDIVDDRLIGALHVRALTHRGFAHDPVAERTAFQVGTLDALIDGRYDGDTTMGELLAHGDLGLGTVQHLGGELIVIDGEAFVVDGDGAVHPVPPETPVPASWRDFVEGRLKVPTPALMTDGRDPWVRSWEAGYDPANSIDAAVLRTREAVFPYHGLAADPYHGF